MIMEAHTDARLLQSKYEENVQKYAEHAPGYTAGKSYNETIKLTNHLYEGQKPTVVDTVSVFLSFDIKKWHLGCQLQNMNS